LELLTQKASWLVCAIPCPYFAHNNVSRRSKNFCSFVMQDDYNSPHIFNSTTCERALSEIWNRCSVNLAQDRSFHIFKSLRLCIKRDCLLAAILQFVIRAKSINIQKIHGYVIFVLLWCLLKS